MRTDVKILQTYNLMDYSLLMGIQDNPDFVQARKDFANSQDQSFNSSNRNSIDSSSGEMQLVRSRF